MATVEYQPRGRGFHVRLATELFEAVATGTGLDDDKPDVSGSPELTDNVALVALLLGYATNELDYRRLRSPEKRKSRREAADVECKDAIALADLVGRLGGREVTEWCSGCFSKATHRHVKGADRPRRTYLCQACGTPTVECAVPGCSHHAVVRPRARITLRHCAAHTHSMPGFEKLDARIPTLGDYKDFLEYEVFTADRVTKVAGGTIGAAAVIAPVALFAAPAVGAALGSSMLGGSLTGAAATSHGLAMLGGGAVASGGLGMAGGSLSRAPGPRTVCCSCRVPGSTLSSTGPRRDPARPSASLGHGRYRDRRTSGSFASSRGGSSTSLHFTSEASVRGHQ